MAFSSMKHPFVSSWSVLTTTTSPKEDASVPSRAARKRKPNARASASPSAVWQPLAGTGPLNAHQANTIASPDTGPILKPELSHPSFVSRAAGAIGPTAVMVGGTAAMYTSLLHHPSSTLTPLSILYMLLLAIQTSVQPRLSRKYIPKTTPKVRVALVEEVIKTSAASVLFWGRSGPGVVQEALKDWTLQSSLIVAGLPACLYAVQGVLTYMSHQHLDSVTFNGLSQTKTLSAALCCYMVMGKPQSPLQMVALALLFLSAIIFQNGQSFSSNKNDNSVSPSSSNTGSSSKNNNEANLQSNVVALKGIIPCLAATFISGLAGAFSQKGLQMVGTSGGGRNAFLYTVEVSFFSAVALLVPQLFSSSSTSPSSSSSSSSSTIQQQQQQQQATPDKGWDRKALIPITCKAMGGILTALVHKHAGSVVKGFALMLGLVMSGILQSLWLEGNNGDNIKGIPVALKWHQVAGIAIVMFSSWLHFTNPPM